MSHRGRIVRQKIVERHKLAPLAAALGISRRTLSTWLSRKDLSWDIIHDIGQEINHDFRKDFREYPYGTPDPKLCANCARTLT